ncbi:DUF1800 domain-containing protein [Kamptonema cortianum]|nr:DUF1800 domain-containing protein [Geitlerinema splendidum]MDK3162263.1 DUF1800 domain-containing protein [Kamptonema cortianum]
MALQTDQQKVAHLLRRFGLGASEAEMEFYGANGWMGAIDKLLDYESIQEPVEIGDIFLRDNNGNLTPNATAAQGVLYSRYLITQRPLEAKMTLFWHDHFATSADKVANGPTMLTHLETLQKHATGKFYNLLLAVSRDPAMLYFLDNQDNIAGQPNENFAREVMELFTLGIGHYTEKDIQEAARAFTGWTFGVTRGNRTVVVRNRVPGPQMRYVFDGQSHDHGSKTVLGKTGNWNGEDILRILCDMPRTAYYITEKMWKWFAYPDPEPALIQRLADAFVKSGLNIKTLAREIMTSSEFYSDKAERAVVKNPVDFVIPTMRQLGFGAGIVQQVSQITNSTEPQGARRAIAPGILAKQSTTNMGMELLYPPDVAGWPRQTQWISTSTMTERIKWGTNLFMGPNNRPNLYPAFALFAANPTPTGVVDKLLSVFDCQDLSAKRQALIDAAAKVSNSRIDRFNANQVAAEVCKVIFASPEFQFM